MGTLLVLCRGGSGWWTPSRDRFDPPSYLNFVRRLDSAVSNAIVERADGRAVGECSTTATSKACSD